MTFCMVGKVVKYEIPTTIYVEEIATSEVFKMVWTGRADITQTLGETGIFFGELNNQEYHVKRLDIRKLLIPMWESAVVDCAISAINELENDPFENYFSKYSS